MSISRNNHEIRAEGSKDGLEYAMEIYARLLLNVSKIFTRGRRKSPVRMLHVGVYILGAF